jgi:hypothetical protein
MKLKLPILNNTDETSLLIKMDVDFYYSQCKVGEMIFYNINAISDVIDNNIHYTEIFSNGRMFICPLLLEEVEKLIDEQYSLSSFTI